MLQVATPTPRSKKALGLLGGLLVSALGLSTAAAVTGDLDISVPGFTGRASAEIPDLDSRVEASLNMTTDLQAHLDMIQSTLGSIEGRVEATTSMIPSGAASASAQVSGTTAQIESIVQGLQGRVAFEQSELGRASAELQAGIEGTPEAEIQALLSEAVNARAQATAHLEAIEGHVASLQAMVGELRAELSASLPTGSVSASAQATVSSLEAKVDELREKVEATVASAEGFLGEVRGSASVNIEGAVPVEVSGAASAAGGASVEGIVSGVL